MNIGVDRLNIYFPLLWTDRATRLKSDLECFMKESYGVAPQIFQSKTGGVVVNGSVAKFMRGENLIGATREEVSRYFSLFCTLFDNVEEARGKAKVIDVEFCTDTNVSPSFLSDIFMNNGRYERLPIGSTTMTFKQAQTQLKIYDKREELLRGRRKTRNEFEEQIRRRGYNKKEQEEYMNGLIHGLRMERTFRSNIRRQIGGNGGSRLRVEELCCESVFRRFQEETEKTIMTLQIQRKVAAKAIQAFVKEEGKKKLTPTDIRLCVSEYGLTDEGEVLEACKQLEVFGTNREAIKRGSEAVRAACKRVRERDESICMERVNLVEYTEREATKAAV